MSKLPKFSENHGEKKIVPGDQTRPRIVPVSNSLSGIPHKECGMSQSDRIASLPWDKN